MLLKHLSSFLLCIFCIKFSHLVAIPSCNTIPSPAHFPEEDFQHNDSRLKHGAELQEAGLNAKAIEAYKNLLDQLDASADLTLAMQARFYLAYAYFSMEDYQNSVRTLQDNIDSGPESLLPLQQHIRLHSIYLQALALKKLQDYFTAKQAFLSYTRQNDDTPFHEEALFEIGLLDFLQGNHQEAVGSFRSIAKPHLSILAQFYLARIEQLQGNDTEAATILARLEAQIKQDDPLFFELRYLQGKTAFNRHLHEQAIEYLTRALPAMAPEKMPWYQDTLTSLGWSHLKIADTTADESLQKRQSLTTAEHTFNKLLSVAPSEDAYLAMAQCYLSQAKHLKLTDYAAKAEEILSQTDRFTTKEGQAHALLLRAEATPTYIARNELYRQLIAEAQDSPTFYAKGWYLYALNDFEHGKTLLSSRNIDAAQQAFERAEKAFGEAFSLLVPQEPQQAGTALKYQALAMSYSHMPEAELKAFQLLDKLVSQLPDIWRTMDNHDELYYLHGYFAGKLGMRSNQNQYLPIAQQSLLAVASMPDSSFSDKALHTLGALYYQHGDYQKAEDTYLRLVQDLPSSNLAAEAWLWAARCADELKKDPQVGKQRRQYAFEHYPLSPYTAEAYFTYYTYPEYIQGDRASIKHLKNFINTYHDSPFLIDAHFLMGLDYKRDRKTPEGKWIRKKSLTDAIDSLQKAEILYDELVEKELIPKEKLDYYMALRDRAIFERALANLAIANDAQGAKRQIYLDYAEEVFKELTHELRKRKESHAPPPFQQNDFPLIEEESAFWLAQTYMKANKDENASAILNEMLNRYQQMNVTKGYYLARTQDELGNIAMRKKDFPAAMHKFKLAEEANKGQFLSTHQKLDLWIRESMCYREMKQFDEAILILSKVINDDAISTLRLKAMFLRAEIYELQKRPELARKQLESMVKKGGLWAKKAQEKLEKEYFNEH